MVTIDTPLYSALHYIALYFAPARIRKRNEMMVHKKTDRSGRAERAGGEGIQKIIYYYLK